MEGPGTERVKNTRGGVTGVIANPQPSASPKGPHDVHARREHAEVKGIIQPNATKHVVREDRSWKKLKNSVLRGLGRRDVPAQGFKAVAELWIVLAEQPPVLAAIGAIVVVAIRLHGRQHT